MSAKPKCVPLSTCSEGSVRGGLSNFATAIKECDLNAGFDAKYTTLSKVLYRAFASRSYQCKAQPQPSAVSTSLNREGAESDTALEEQ